MIVDPGILPPPGGRLSLLKALEQVTDPRARRGIRHSIASTLAMVVAAGLSGAGRSFRSVGDFTSDLPQDALARLGARFHPVQRRYIAPNEATIRRHVQMIDADEADAAVGGWLTALVEQTRAAAGQEDALTMVALDGKVLKGAWEELPDVKVKLFSALVHGEGVIIGQRKVPEGTTEVTQVLPLLDGIATTRYARAGPDGDRDLTGLVFTADALHVHRDNLRQVTDRGGEYIVTVKGNQPRLERDISAPFPANPADGAFPPSPRHHRPRPRPQRDPLDLDQLSRCGPGLPRRVPGVPHPPRDLRPELEPAAQARNRARDHQPDRLASQPRRHPGRQSRPLAGREPRALRPRPDVRRRSLPSPHQGLPAVPGHSPEHSDQPHATGRVRQHRPRPGIPVPPTGLRPDALGSLTRELAEGGDTNARTLPMALG